MGRAFIGVLIGIITLVLSIIISIILWMMGIPLFFLVFFLPLIGFSFLSWGEKEEEPPRLRQFGIMQYKFCPRCGYQLEGWERFCPVCGFKLRED